MQLTRWLTWMICAAAAAPVWADPGYYVVTTYSDAGKVDVNLRYWTTKRPGRPEMVWPEVGVGYGVTDRWYSQLFVSAIGRTIGETNLDSINWQNDYLLTQGQYPVDVAVHTQLVRNVGESNVLEFGPALQTDIGRTQLNFNLIFERNLSGPVVPTALKYQWQLRHRWQPWLNFGAQGFGEVGPWEQFDAWAKQSHRAGPAAFGRFDLEGERAVHWQAAFLRGKVYGHVGQMFTMQMKYAY